MESGNTILTLIVSLLCIGILSSISISGSKEFLSRKKVQYECDRVVRYFDELKLLSRKSNRKVTIQISPSLMVSDAQRKYVFSRLLTLEGAPSIIRFYPDLLAQPGTLLLRSKSHMCSVVISLRSRITTRIWRL